MVYKTSLLLPARIHLSIVKQKNNYWCMIYNNYFLYKLFLNNTQSLHFNKEINSLTVKLQSTSSYNKLYSIILEKLFFSWNFFFFSKFKLKGKGFRIYRRRQNKFMKFFFGYSHFKIIQFKLSLLLKLGKYKFLVLNTSNQALNKVIKLVQSVKPINLFTKRGLRAARQIVLKRRGKSLIF